MKVISMQDIIIIIMMLALTPPCDNVLVGFYTSGLPISADHSAAPVQSHEPMNDGHSQPGQPLKTDSRPLGDEQSPGRLRGLYVFLDRL